MELHHTFYCGDVMEVLWCLPEASVDCVVTSPPYRNLRDYRVEGQIGLEQGPEEYIDRLVAVFDQVWQALKPSGSVWVNLGHILGSRPGTQPEQEKHLCRPR